MTWSVSDETYVCIKHQLRRKAKRERAEVASLSLLVVSHTGTTPREYTPSITPAVCFLMFGLRMEVKGAVIVAT